MAAACLVPTAAAGRLQRYRTLYSRVLSGEGKAGFDNAAINTTQRLPLPHPLTAPLLCGPAVEQLRGKACSERCRLFTSGVLYYDFPGRAAGQGNRCERLRAVLRGLSRMSASVVAAHRAPVSARREAANWLQPH
jgi:hypothetical protein